MRTDLIARKYFGRLPVLVTYAERRALMLHLLQLGYKGAPRQKECLGTVHVHVSPPTLYRDPY